MSMILDALTRAEQERQLEKQPDLKFVTPVKQGQKKSNNIWLWVTLALIANLVVLIILLRPDSSSKATTEIAVNEPANTRVEPVVQAPMQTQVTEEIATFEVAPTSSINDAGTATITTPTVRPLAMELNSKALPELDRPLIYEAKQAKTAQQINTTSNESTPTQVATATPSKKGAVSFSEAELSVDETAQPIVNTPKLLIDQSETMPPISNVPNLKDLPVSSRNSLNQYEVNVHVFDDNPERRFVLINMDKYKEGDRIADNGPLVQEITREGVIVDYGNGRALLPPK